MAVSQNTNEVQIYAKAGTKWEVAHTLTEVCERRGRRASER